MFTSYLIMCERIPDVGHTPPWDVTLMMVCSAFLLEDFFSAACFVGGFCANIKLFHKRIFIFCFDTFFFLGCFWSPCSRVSAAIPLEA